MLDDAPTEGENPQRKTGGSYCIFTAFLDASGEGAVVVPY